MKFKIDEAYTDIYGTNCIKFNTKNLKAINDWLWDNYQGYKFVIVIDCMKDEYLGAEECTLVYFADEALDELAYTYDYELKKKRG